MTQIEDRVRSALEAEAEAIGAARSAQTTSQRRRVPWSGAGIALAAGAVVLVVFGGLSLLTRGGGDLVNQPVTTPSAPSAPDTSVPSINEDGLFEAMPFSGETWQFTVTEELKPSLGTYEVCFLLDPVSGASDLAGSGAPWCEGWPTDPRVTGHLIGVHHGLPSNSSFVLVVELSDRPVDRVTITGEDIDATVVPYALPGSGRQFAVVEVPQSDGLITIEAFDPAGIVLDQQDGILGQVDPVLENGTPVDDTTVSKVATSMGGEPLPDEELERITGSAGLAHSGYLIESTTAGEGAYELGLIVYREEPLEPMGLPTICFSGYAMTRGVNVAGGATCADSQEKAEELAEFHLSGGGSCGGIPKEEPVVEGIWTHLAVWGIPQAADTVKVGLGDGTAVEVETDNGVALHLWEESVDIASIEFDGMTDAQRDLISSFVPARGIGSDCGRGDTSGG